METYFDRGMNQLQNFNIIKNRKKRLDCPSQDLCFSFCFKNILSFQNPVVTYLQFLENSF